MQTRAQIKKQQAMAAAQEANDDVFVSGTNTHDNNSDGAGTQELTQAIEISGTNAVIPGTPKPTYINNAGPGTVACDIQMPLTPPKSPDAPIASTCDNVTPVHTESTPTRQGIRVVSVKEGRGHMLIVIKSEKPIVLKTIESVVPAITEPIVFTTKKRGHDDDDEADVMQPNKRPAYPGAGHIDFNDRRFTKYFIWAKRRQGLCESIAWYHSYNSSLYNCDLTAIGLMVDEACVVDAQVVITTIGGGRKVIKDKDNEITIKREKHQPITSPAYKSFKKTMEEKLLVGVIVGNKHPRFVNRKPRYMVLDFFHVTEIWSEKFKDKKGCREFRVRLEKANLNTASWWDLDRPHYQLPGAKVEKKTCAMCKKASKHIFKAGWTCLTSTCTQFYKDAAGNRIWSNEYTDAFLNEREGFSGPVPSIIPAEPKTDGQHGSEEAMRAGRVCPMCNCCSSRKFWLGWSCENCGWEQPVKMKEYPAAQLKQDMQKFEAKVKGMRKRNGIDSFVFTKLDSHLLYRYLVFGQYQVAQVLIPDPQGIIIGSVTIFQANDAIRRRGPDDLFRELSTTDIGLQRNVVSANNSPCEGWTRHFGQNWGAQYKFGVKVQSKPFSEAPDCILKSYKRMDFLGHVGVRAAKQFVESGNAEGKPDTIHDMPDLRFNELLSLGYMEGDKINYHDDGEHTVGPTVASLSLGSPAIMRFRPKAASGMGFSVVDEMNCPKKMRDGAVNAETVEVEPTDDDDVPHDEIVEGAEKGDEIVVEGTAPKKPVALYGDVLKFELRHGDVLVMHGSGIHKYYEHAVEPAGGRRFALTCRYIVPEKIKDLELRRVAPINGTLPPHAAEFAYSGDLDLGYLNDGLNRGERI